MNLLFKTLIIASVFTVAPHAQSAPYVDQGPASIKITPGGPNGGETTETIETRFIQLGYPNQNILKAIVTNTTIEGLEGANGTVQLEVRGDGTGRLDKVLWSTSTEGNEVKIVSDDFVGTVSWGCCGSSNVTRLFNVNSGKKVEAVIGEAFTFNVPNSSLAKRYVSPVIDSKAPANRNGKTYIGTFSYFDANRIIARARVYADLPSGWGTEFTEFKVVDLKGGVSKMEAQNGSTMLWGADGETNPDLAFNDFAVEAKLYYDKQIETVRIAIKGDTIDAQATSGSKGVEIEFVR